MNTVVCLKFGREGVLVSSQKLEMTAALSINRRTQYSPHSELFGSAEGAHRIRYAVVVAHPNDEIVGSACLISKRAPLAVVHVSNGAPDTIEEAQRAGFRSRREYAEARQQECISALALADIPPEKVIEWGLPQFEASYQLVDLSKRLMNLFRERGPQVVLTHAYEGGHPDHDATAFAVHAAVSMLRRNGLKPPMIYEMAIYPGNDGQSRVPEFLFASARESTTLVLDEPTARLKQQMFDCFSTQRDVLVDTPLGPEKFREAPVYDFRLPPYFRELQYEKLNWQLTGREWRSLARQALKALFPRALMMSNLAMPRLRLQSSA